MKTLLSEEDALKILRSGGIVAVPTETVYGLACVAENKDAVAEIYAIKQRPADNPLICHFYSLEQLKQYVQPINDIEEVLIQHFCPGPLSFVLTLRKNSPLSFATGGRESVVARIPAHPLFLSLLTKMNKPLAAPSANTSGKFSATNAQMVLHDLGDKIQGVLDGGESINGLESTIIQTTSEEIIILRPGVIGPNELEEILKEKFPNIKIHYGTSAQTTPGAHYKHYAPHTPLFEIKNISEWIPDSSSALITVDEILNTIHRQANILSLGSIHQPNKIASSLYKTMFLLDEMHLKQAFVFLPEITDAHWHITIRNRLNKMLEAD